MLARARRLFLLALLLILPVQSMAAGLESLACSVPDHAHAGSGESVMQAHAATQAGGTRSHAHAHDAHPARGDHSDGRLCCHHLLSSAMATDMITLSVPHDFRVFASSIELLATLHIPELPRRPPRV